MNNKITPLIVGLAIISLLGIYSLKSCKNDANDKDSKEKTKLSKQFCCEKKNSSATDKIKIYLETSISMKGYVVPLGDCTAVYKLKDLAMILPILTQKGANYELYTVSDQPKIYNSDIDDFTKFLTNGDIFCEKQSRLQNSLCSILDSLDKNEIGIFISDCILDLGSSIDNKANLPIATGKILNHIIMRKEKRAVVFYQYFSDFNGNFYYNYKNEQKYLNKLMHLRPVYILIIGQPENLKTILGDKIFDPGLTNSYSYNLKYDTSDVTFQILQYRQKGKMLIKPNFQSIEFKDYSRDNDFAFTIGVDLSSLPGYACNFDYLITRKNLLINPQFLSAKIFIKSIEEAKKDPKFNLVAEKVCPHITHIITVTLLKLQEKNEIYTLLIKQEEPAWVNSAHIPDDRFDDPKSIEGKTFGLKAITGAFKRSSDTLTPLLQIPFRISK